MGPRLGVSACLLGERVRYDGGHKCNDRLLHIFHGVEWVAVCPEAELGLGVPRPKMHLEEGGSLVALKVTGSDRDLTGAMTEYAERRVAELDLLDGYVFKSKSPSCAIASALIEGEQQAGEDRGAGLFTRVFSRAFPLVPMCEEVALESQESREAFVHQVFAAFERRLRDSDEDTAPVSSLLQTALSRCREA